MDYPKDYGHILLTQYPNKTEVELFLKGLPPGKHGFHVHKSADRRQGCKSACSHYNPFNGTHKGVNEAGNHLGDLGNITVDANGTCNQKITVNYLPLTGEYQIIGRTLVLHELVDDLGLGSNAESKKTGNSGDRIACGVIGYLETVC